MFYNSVIDPTGKIFQRKKSSSHWRHFITFDIPHSHHLLEIIFIIEWVYHTHTHFNEWVSEENSLIFSFLFSSILLSSFLFSSVAHFVNSVFTRCLQTVNIQLEIPFSFMHLFLSIFPFDFHLLFEIHERIFRLILLFFLPSFYEVEQIFLYLLRC